MKLNWLHWLLLAAIGGLVVFGLIARRAALSEWNQLDSQRKENIDKLVQQAALEAQRADGWRVVAKDLQAKLVASEDALEASRKRVIKRPRPMTVADCTVQLTDLENHIALLDERLSLEQQKVVALEQSLDSQTRRAEILEQAWRLERSRAEALKKNVRRERLKKGFLGVGLGLAGGLIGYGVGAATR